MKLSMIAALGRNRVIGADGGMPWRIPEDLAYFKAMTLGKPVVMGRRTFESIGRPLPGRPNIVVTGDPGFAAGGAMLAADPARAMETAAGLGVAGEIMVIGGGRIYDQLLDRADRLYLTEIDLAPPGDAFFPDFRARGAWAETRRERRPARGDAPGLDFVVYDRR